MVVRQIPTFPAIAASESPAMVRKSVKYCCAGLYWIIMSEIMCERATICQPKNGSK